MIKFKKLTLWLTGFLSACLLCIWIPSNYMGVSALQPTTSVSPNSEPLLQQGKIYYQTGRLKKAAEIWEQAVKNFDSHDYSLYKIQLFNYLALVYHDLGKQDLAEENLQKSLNLLQNRPKLNQSESLLLAQALNTQGMLEFSQGKTEMSLKTWQKATNIYSQVKDTQGKLISQINQAQALQTLGQYRQAKSLLEQLILKQQAQPDTLIKAQGLRSLGVALQTLGDLLQSKTILEQSWSISADLDSQADISSALFSLANVARDLNNDEVALNYYQEVIQLSSDPLLTLEVKLNKLSLLVELERWDEVYNLIPQVETNLAQIHPSRPSIYAKLNFTESLNKGKADKQVILKWLEIAIQEAQQIEDPRATAYALYQLGQFYQTQGDLGFAKSLTQRSLNIAQEINAIDIVARTSAQLGRILSQQRDIDGAISAYQIAFINLQSLRSDLVAITPDLQFDFKETIEPVYRELVSLLLTPLPLESQVKEVSQANLKKAREVMEALQIAELDNFFRDACIDTYPISLEQIDVNAAVIYPIILQDRLEVILSIPNEPLRHYNTPLSQTQITETLTQLYSSLSPGYPNDQRLKLSQQVYDWLVAPAEIDLQQSKIKTLVFIPDGFLRNLPMSVLYDGNQYLIAKYDIALSPGLQLFAQGLQLKDKQVLVGALTEARQGFKALPGVNDEIKQVTAEIPSEVLLNQKFTQDSFKTTLENQSFPIVHLATHGQFSSNPEETFLLTWSDRLSINDFDLLFQKRRLGIIDPIELLVMSACQTASGDERATLGLAGFALRSGARSTIASLWSVSDESTATLMSEFYHQLTVNQLSKGEALRQAQLKMLENPLYKHPYFWAGFVLVGNWL